MAEMNTTGGAMLDQWRHFDWLDYSLFGLMLGVSTLIGVYFGCFGDRQRKTVDYLLGGKNMGVFPVAVSLVASSISGITMMGVPAEMYTHGAMYSLVFISAVVMGVITNFVYLPVFFKMQLTSTYEYLELRFNRNVRTMASVLYTINLLLYIPIVIYVPCLALSQVSGLSVHLISPLVCIICIFYTMLGGLKAVVWTDFVQGFVIVGAGILVIILGVIHVGGLSTVWQRNLDGGRFDIMKFDPSPLNRDTVWAIVIGLTTMWLAYSGVNQGFVQKYMSMPNLGSARKALLIYVVGLMLMNSISCFTGFVIYATYFRCDPLATKVIKRPDQLLPYFVMDTATGIPGLPGVFIAGIFSGALSTMSSALNSLSATIYEDFVQPCVTGRLRDDRANLILKLIVVVIGVICVLMVFIVEQLGAVLELSYSVGAITCGALLGLFSLGMLFPWANGKGAMSGAVTSMAIVGWIVFGAQNAIRTGELRHKALPTSVEGCGLNETLFNATALPEVEPEEPFVMFRIAFQYLAIIGCFWVITVGLIVSYLTGPCDPNQMNRDLFVTFIGKYVTFKKKGANESAEKAPLNTFDLKNTHNY